MKVGFSVGTQPPFLRVHATLRALRVLGFDSAWVVDHFLGFLPQALWDRDFTWMARPGTSPHPHFDFQTLIGRLSGSAGRLTLGVGVTEPIRRHPVLLAQAALTLSHLTKRPPILGIGAGEAENIIPYGLDFSTPVSVLEEALQIIRLCFESRGPINYSGRHFDLDRAVMDLGPGRAGTPHVWVAAHGPRMLRLCGEYGDGWYPTLPMTPAQYSSKLEAVRSAAVATGRDPLAIEPALHLYTVLAPTEAEARAMLDTPALRFFSLLTPASMWQAEGVEHPFGAGFRGYVDFVPTRYSRAEYERAMAAVPVELVAAHAAWGTPEMVVRHIRDLEEVGLRHVVVSPLSALVSSKAARFALRSVVAMAKELRRSTES